jgi:VIT1/CCC1 family predicted Fe2+/Mn2+ transporter
MKHSIKVGFNFGLNSGVITTLGLMIGLNSSTNSSLVVIGGILTIAIADSLSDSLGIHISEESENKHTKKEIWESTFSTFFSKFIITSLFVIPILFLELKYAIIFNIFFGFSILFLSSFNLAKNQNTKTWIVIVEHFIIAVIVIILAHYVGHWISIIFS